ncbi:MAG: hypothetical protein WBX01_04970 [Nitrososphaeraceae archaeon]
MNLIRCPYETLSKDNPDTLGFISGQVRVRGKGGGEYPFHYLEMIDYVFSKEENTIEACSGSLNGGCFTVDINPKTNPCIVDDGQTLVKILNNTFSRWRCDPPYNGGGYKLLGLLQLVNKTLR